MVPIFEEVEMEMITYLSKYRAPYEVAPKFPTKNWSVYDKLKIVALKLPKMV